jgi:hypothetical protein
MMRIAVNPRVLKIRSQTRKNPPARAADGSSYTFGKA